MLRRINSTITKNDKEFSEVAKMDVWVLYREVEDGYVFAGLHNPDIPDEDYADHIVAFPLRSVYQRKTFLENGTPVWNVNGSTGDVLKEPVNPTEEQKCGKFSNWKDSWEKLTSLTANKCFVEGAGIVCNNDVICGGHMQLYDPQSSKMRTGETAYIIPICSKHNNHNVTDVFTVKGDILKGAKIGVWALEILYEQPK